MTDSADQINQSRVVSLIESEYLKENHLGSLSMGFPNNFYKLRCTHPAVQVTLTQKLTDSLSFHVMSLIWDKTKNALLN